MSSSCCVLVKPPKRDKLPSLATAKSLRAKLQTYVTQFEKHGGQPFGVHAGSVSQIEQSAGLVKLRLSDEAKHFIAPLAELPETQLTEALSAYYDEGKKLTTLVRKVRTIRNQKHSALFGVPKLARCARSLTSQQDSRAQRIQGIRVLETIRKTGWDIERIVQELQQNLSGHALTRLLRDLHVAKRLHSEALGVFPLHEQTHNSVACRASQISAPKSGSPANGCTELNHAT